MRAITNADVVLKDKILKQHAVIYDTQIQHILPSSDVPKDLETFDAGGRYLIPGLIDMHIHGMNGADIMDADEDGLLNIARGLLENGVTGFLPTTVSMDDEGVDKALDNVRLMQRRAYKGARILGAHMEGPYLNERKKGAHEARYLKTPDRGFIQKHLDVIRLLTLAPEIDPDFIEWAVGRGVIVSLGHSMASYEQAVTAFEKGASQVTHLFNGMSGIHHQEPGLAGAGLLCDGVSVEVIADTVHVRKELYPLIYRAKGQDSILLITDCMRAGGMPSGCYKLGRLDVHTDGTKARLSDGSLAGSIERLNKAVRNFEVNAKIPRYAAVAMASYNPARNLGLEKEYGSIEKGHHADMALVDDEMNVSMTIMDGESVFHAGQQKET